MGRARWMGGVNRFVLASAWTLSLGLSAVAQANTVAGELPGELTVSAQGAASYRIPIAVPPGVAGMAPTLALSYSSQGGNGLLGVGWSLEGLSNISRCPATMASEGYVAGVQYNTDDRFCLDGQKLVSVNGVYAITGAEYRTEQESFSRIRAYGEAGGRAAHGPAYFIMQTKAGLSIEYGKTEDARIEAQGSGVARAWAMNATVDAKGGRIEFEYFEDNAAGEHRLRAIRYAGRSVLFQYEARPDVQMGYQAGSRFSLTQRLKAIETYVGSALVQRTEISYNLGEGSQRSRVASIRQCAADGSCLRPVRFQMSDNAQPGHLASYSYSTWGQVPLHKSVQRPKLADINGDGHADLYVLGADRLTIWQGRGDGHFDRTQRHFDASVLAGANNCEAHIVDNNNDGITDLLITCAPHFNDNHQDVHGISAYQWLGEGGGNYGPGRTVLSGSYDSSLGRYTPYVLDLNGDGVLDILYAYAGNFDLSAYQWLGRPDGSFQPAVHFSHRIGDGRGGYQLQPTDLNQDGVIDLVYTRYEDNRALLYASFGARSGGYGPLATRFSSTQFGSMDQYTPYLVDANGDGLVDLLYVRANDQGVSAYLWAGSGDAQYFKDGKQVLSSHQFGNLVGYRPQLADLNGDGLPDLSLVSAAWSNPVRVYQWFGGSDGHFTRGQLGLSHALSYTDRTELFQTDLDQNGSVDLLMAALEAPRGEEVSTTDLSIHRWLGAGAGLSDQLTAITTSAGARHELSYAPLTSPGVYSKDVGGNAARYPVADLIAPLWVVSASAQSNGVGGTNSVSYQYGGLKFEQAQGPGFGRGLLGFRWVRSTEVASGIQTYTEYRQNWPYTGQAVVTQTQLPGYGNGSLLKRTIYNHSCYRTNTSGATASCGEQASGKVIFPFIARTTEESWDLNGAPLPTISTATDYGGTAAANGQTLQLGDATTVEVDITYGGALKSRKRTVNQYNPAQTSGNSWILGRLARAAVTSFSADSPPHANNITRTSSFAYDAQGLLIKEVIEPDDPSICQQTTYTYDAYGNRNRVAASPCPGANGWVIASAGERASTSRFDLQIVHIDGTTYTTGAGIFASTSTNALGHSETRRHDPRHGGVIALTGPNHLTTTWTYDAFGRKTSETRADGTSSRWSFHLCAPEGQSRDPRCPMDIGGAPVDWYALEEHLGASGLPMAAPKLQFYDPLGRIVRIQTQGFDGQGPGDVLVQETHYNHLGQRVRQSILYRLGDSPVWTTYTYDRLGRVATESVPDSAGTATTELIYNGLETAVINAGGQRQTKFSNANGQVERIVNHFGYRTLYFYDALGQLIKTDAYGSITELTYDLRGRKIRMQDPAMGSWDYAYNAFDELVWQSDSLGQTTTLAYDPLGRLIKRSEPDLISDWSYDKKFDGSACGKGMGKLCEARSNNGYRRLHSYDSLGRPVSTQTALDSATVLATVSQSYEAGTGRLATQTWPTGYQATRSYTPLGYLKRIDGQSPDGAADAAASLEILAMDPQGRISSYRQGAHITTVKTHDAVTGNLRAIQSTAAGQASGNLHNQNFVYDKLGNLLIRQDSNLGLLENFTYDGLNRLIYTTAQGGGLASAQAVQLIYDARGNIQYKSDVGYYNYDPQRPNRLAQITLAQPSGWQGSAAVAVANTGTRALAYAFDDARTGAKTNSAGQPVGNGNLWYTVSQDAASGKHTVRWETYTSFNQPKEILFGNLISPENPTATTADRRLTFLYGPEHQRIKQKLEFTSNAPSHMQEGSIYYLNGTDGQALTYEKEIKTSGLIEHRHFLSAAGITFALYTQREGHLGGKSAREVNYWHHDHLGSLAAISSPSGALIERLAFDAWGKRRHLSGAADSQDALYGQSTSRGYTLHEHLDEVGVIHMNGRVYDPLIGRFMSADPFIQAPQNLQSHNRYAYVLNNPLTFTDPSGYFSLKKALRIAVAVFVAVQLGPWIYAQMKAAAIASGTFTKAAAIQMKIAAGFASGVASGMISSGGDVESAYKSGLTAALFAGAGLMGNPESNLRYAAHAAAGCISAAAGGDKCGRGATAALFGKYITNALQGSDLLGDIGKGVATSIAGGVGSVIAGGKFENGAITAAFGYLYNYCLTQGCAIAEKEGHLPTEQQTRNIFRISKLPHVDSAPFTLEAQQVAADMYFTALEVDKGMIWIERAFRSVFAPNPSGLLRKLAIDTVRAEAKETYQLGEHKSLESRYAATGAAIVNRVGATHKTRYFEEALRAR